MKLKTELSRTILFEKHQLSHQQIDLLLGENSEQTALQSKLSQIALTAELICIYDLLTASGIEFVTLKGPLLSYRLFGDPSFRLAGDIDILVKPETVNESVILFKSAGYSILEPDWPDTVKPRKVILEHCHHLTLCNKTNGVVVELHWKFFRILPVRIDELNEIIKKNLLQIEFQGRRFNALSIELELVYLIIHGGIHFWSKMKWILDIETLLKKNKVDWNKAQKLMDELHARRPVALYQALVKRIFIDYSKMTDVGYAPDYLINYCYTQFLDRRDASRSSNLNAIKDLWYLLRFYPGFRGLRDIVKAYLFPESKYSKSFYSASILHFYIYGLYYRLSSIIRRIIR